MAYPIHFDVQLPERQSRLTTFFRLILVIPHLFVLAVWAFLVEFSVFFAWFAILFTGRYPRGLFNFGAGFLSYSTRVSCYLYLLTDRFPPFGGRPADPFSSPDRRDSRLPWRTSALSPGCSRSSHGS